MFSPSNSEEVTTMTGKMSANSRKDCPKRRILSLWSFRLYEDGTKTLCSFGLFEEVKLNSLKRGLIQYMVLMPKMCQMKAENCHFPKENEAKVIPNQLQSFPPFLTNSCNCWITYDPNR